MATSEMQSSISTQAIDAEKFRQIVQANQGRWKLLGVIMIIVGFLAILMPVVTGLWAVFVLGILLIIGGIAQVIHAFGSRGWSGFGLQLILGIFYAAVGVLLTANPLKGLVALTLVVAIFLLIDGAARLTLAIQIKGAKGWGWLLVGGLITLFLGLIVFLEWPGDSEWIIGLFLGIDLVIWGATLLALASGSALATKESPDETM